MALQLVATELVGYPAVAPLYSPPFDVFDGGVPQQLAFAPHVHPLTRRGTLLAPFTLRGGAAARKQPIVRVLDVNGSLVDAPDPDREALVPVEVSLERAADALPPGAPADALPPLLGGAQSTRTRASRSSRT